ncbi:MAG: roadblock/LC7 domain-containing protein [Candidatus Hodarchaeota archaeon]
MGELLNELERRSEVKASAIVSREGLMMASKLPGDIDEDAISAMSAGMLSLGTRVGNILKCGEIEQIIIKGAEGITITMDAGPEAVLILIAPADAKLGMIFFDVKITVEGIKELLKA